MTPISPIDIGLKNVYPTFKVGERGFDGVGVTGYRGLRLGAYNLWASIPSNLEPNHALMRISS